MDHYELNNIKLRDDSNNSEQYQQKQFDSGALGANTIVSFADVFVRVCVCVNLFRKIEQKKYRPASRY